MVDLEAVIDRLEEEVLQDLLGVPLYEAFLTDLDLDTGAIPKTPTEPRFLDIYDKFFETDPQYLRSEGMIKMLQMFIWFEFTKDLPVRNTPVGLVKSALENSKGVSSGAAGIEKTYNRGLRTYRSIQEKVILNQSTYSEYDNRSIYKEIISFV